jgi:RNA polymerase sigma-70 factor (ECF subfamily)
LTEVRDPDGVRRFESLLMPHLAAGYNLARWLTRNEHDAQDLVQDAYLRAFRAFDGYRGGNPRAWLLAIVRNTCFAWLRQQRSHPVDSPPDDDPDELADDPAAGPEAQVLRHADSQILRGALEELPVEFREAVILRELEGLSYKEIADVVGAPLGTVMSRLSRGRRQLEQVIRRRTGGSDT